MPPNLINRLIKFKNRPSIVLNTGWKWIENLLDSGFIVKEVNSSYTKKQRSIGTNHNKSVELDALGVAKILIFEFKHLPFADPQDVYLAIQQTLNTRNNVVQMTANIKMSLQNILVHHYPMHKEFFKDLESKTAKGFIKK